MRAQHGFHDAVVYQVYPKSYRDTDGDGVGDLRGVIEKVPYIASLGVDYVWLNSFYPSPGRNNGYDIADYRAIDPAMGAMEDFDALTQALAAHGISPMLDMVLNHVSTQHAWFQAALAGHQRYRDYFYIRPAKADGSLPTNWVSKFGGPARAPFGPVDQDGRPMSGEYGFSSLIGVITGSMIPVIGVLAASGILKGILALLTQLDVVDSGTPTYTFIDAMSSSMFYFLPIIIGFTAARRLGADPIIVAIIGGVLTYPSVVAMSNPATEGHTVTAQIGRTVFNSDFFGLPVALPEGNAYAYSIFPIIVAAWLASRIEPWLKKVIPAVVRSIFAPLLEIFIVSALVLVVFGPIVMTISGAIASGMTWVLSLSYPVAGFVIGGLYQCLVIFGLHWAVIPIISQQIADPGYSPLNANVSVSMIAQGGGALAIWINAKNVRVKRLAGPATISAMCGVTEPAMYGLNLKYGRVFITASIGGAVGGLLTGLFDVNMWGFIGAFVGFPSFVNPEGLNSSFTGFWIASVVTLVVSFVCTYFFGFKESDFETEKKVEKVRLGNREPVAR